MQDVVIVDAARSPVGKKNGSLGGAHPTDVLGQVMMKVLERNQLDSAVVDQIVGRRGSVRPRRVSDRAARDQALDRKSKRVRAGGPA